MWMRNTGASKEELCKWKSWLSYSFKIRNKNDCKSSWISLDKTPEKSQDFHMTRKPPENTMTFKWQNPLVLGFNCPTVFTSNSYSWVFPVQFVLLFSWHYTCPEVFLGFSLSRCFHIEFLVLGFSRFIFPAVFRTYSCLGVSPSYESKSHTRFSFCGKNISMATKYFNCNKMFQLHWHIPSVFLGLEWKLTWGPLVITVNFCSDHASLSTCKALEWMCATIAILLFIIAIATSTKNMHFNWNINYFFF